MLIRSSPVNLERKRVPFGPQRINQDHPLAPFCRGLWLFSTDTFGQDLTKNSPRLTLNNGAFPLANKEGLSLDSHVVGGAYVALPAALRITSGHGLSTYARWVASSTAPDAFGNVFGISYDSYSANPFVVNMIQRQNATDLYNMHNYGGTYGGGLPSTNNTTAGVVTSNVISQTFGVSVKGYQAGTQIVSELTNTAAPAYGAAPQILIGGADTWTSRNAQVNVFICAIFNQGLTQADSLDLETNPYALVEPVRTLLWMGPANAAAGGGANILLGNTFGRPFNSFGRPF